MAVSTRQRPMANDRRMYDEWYAGYDAAIIDILKELARGGLPWNWALVPGVWLCPWRKPALRSTASTPQKRWWPSSTPNPAVIRSRSRWATWVMLR